FNSRSLFAPPGESARNPGIWATNRSFATADGRGNLNFWIARDSLGAAAMPSWEMYETPTIRSCGFRGRRLSGVIFTTHLIPWIPGFKRCTTRSCQLRGTRRPANESANRDVLLWLVVLRIRLGETRPLLGQVFESENRRNGTNRDASAAI